MVSPRLLAARSRLVFSSVGLLTALVACGAQSAGESADGAGGILGSGSSVGLGSGPSASGAPSGAGSSAAGGNASGPSSGGASPSANGGAPGTAGAASGGSSGGALCAGVTPWALGTTASAVSHGGKRYSCKVAGWCASTASAYEPGVGFAWHDAWQDDGSCGSGGSAGSGSGGATGVAGSGNGSAGAPSTGGCALDAVLGESNFQAWYPGRNAFYTYANLCKAIAKYPAFASTGDTTAKKREVAGFFANVARETGNLKFIDQISKDPANGNYWGRGPLQLTWNYNYQACGKAINADLLGNPGLVSSDGAITWETALWFWMTNDGGTGKTPHQAIVAGSFGGTIDAINGGLECNGPNEGANERIAHYESYTKALAVDPGGSLTCW